MKIQFSIVIKVGNTNISIIINFQRIKGSNRQCHVREIVQTNGMMESLFGILKSEMFYGYEKTFHSLEQLEQAIVDYIDYYNNKRIKVKLKGLSPV